MSQYDFGTIDPNVMDGTQLATSLNAWRDAVHSGHSGVARPSYVVAGMLWSKQVSATAIQVMYYDGTQDILFGTFNPTDHTLALVNAKTIQLNGAPLGTAATHDVGTGSGNVVALDTSSRLPAVDAGLLTNTLPARHFAGLYISMNTTDPINDTDISSGECRSSDDTMDLIVTPSTITKQIDVAFAEYVNPATPSGGRDPTDNLTGAKWFRVFIIGGPGKNPQPFFTTKTLGTMTFPSGFTVGRLAWYVYWTGSKIKDYWLSDLNTIRWLKSTPDYSASASTSRVLVTLASPPGMMAHAILLQNGSSASSVGLVTALWTTYAGALVVGTDTSMSFDIYTQTVTSLQFDIARDDVIADGNSQVYLQSSIANANVTINAGVASWKMLRF